MVGRIDGSGPANRRWFDQTLALQIAEAQRQSLSSCLPIPDLDHFKDVNDAHGPRTGDPVIRTAAERLVSCLGDDSFSGRFGGAEFAVAQRNDGSAADLKACVGRVLAALRAKISQAD